MLNKNKNINLDNRKLPREGKSIYEEKTRRDGRV